MTLTEHEKRGLDILTGMSMWWVNSDGAQRQFAADFMTTLAQRYPIDAEPPAPAMAIGMQTAGHFDYVQGRIWSDLMHGSGEWIKAGAQRELAEVDDLGNPMEAAWCVLKPKGVVLPAGEYAMTWDDYTGPGPPVLTGPGVIPTRNKVYRFDDGAVKVDTTGGCRGLKIQHIDHGVFLPTLDPLIGRVHTLRIVQDLRVNEAGPVGEGEMNYLFNKLDAAGIDYGERTAENYWRFESRRWVPDDDKMPTMEHTRYSNRRGVPIGACVEIAHHLKAKRVWVNQPLTGDIVIDQDYAYKMGAEFGVTRMPVDYAAGNENWNDGTQKTACKLAGEGDERLGAARLTSACWESFQSGYAETGGDIKDVRLAVMGHVIKPEWVGSVLSNLLALGTKPDLVGCSYYLPLTSSLRTELKQAYLDDPDMPEWSGYKLVQAVVDDAWPRFEAGLSAHAALAKEYGAEPACYEGQLSIILGNLANKGRLNQLAVEAADDPEAERVISDQYAMLRALGYVSVVPYAWVHGGADAKYGIFGHWKPDGTPLAAGRVWLEETGK